ncbi:MAG TPA: TolC family protein, partial [Gammaproteobacteria bacterium]|nr:TolC family protein [Gammaproteobacteria bacterium]
MLRQLLLASGLVLAAAPAAYPADLWQVFQLAQSNDPAFREALANRNASMQAKPAAWANIFPSIDLNASRTWDNTHGDRLSFFGTGVFPVQSSSNDRNDQWGAQLTQTLFNWQQFQALKGANFTVAQAEATYQSTLQGLIVTVSQAYFNVLNARDVLNADIANAKSLGKQYQQTQEQYKVGLIAVTGVREAEAGYDQARAQVIADRQALAQAEEALRAITGQYIGKLAEPQKKLPLHPPQPESVDTWVAQGLKENPSLIASQFGTKVAQNQVAQQRGGYMPQLNLVLQ